MPYSQLVSAKAFTADLQKAIREYTRARDITPVVKVTLADGGSHYVMRATPGASDVLVALDVYPERARDLLDIERLDDQGVPEKVRETRQVLVISPARISKIELLDVYPGGRGAFGFQSPPEDGP
jgi:hypothetical protein